MSTPLSVLDIQWPGHLPELVPALEAMGYHRYWVSEHHSPRQSASPTIMTALAAGLCERMRVGPAGILLKLAAPARVVEDFSLLQLFFPGRIDLGLAGAVPDEVTERAYRPDMAVGDGAVYTDRLRRLAALLADSERRDPETPALGPVGDGRPQLWLCGTSASAAKLAGELGFNFAFHLFLSRAHDPRPPDPRDVAAAYRSSFRPRRPGDQPYLAVAGYGACAEDGPHAEAAWQAHFAGKTPPPPTFIGSPARCANQLHGARAAFDADEIVVDCLMGGLGPRLEGLDALARAWR